jgi:hypothetical protein
MVVSAHCIGHNESPGIEHEHIGNEKMTKRQRRASVWLHAHTSVARPASSQAKFTGTRLAHRDDIASDEEHAALSAGVGDASELHSAATGLVTRAA